MFETAKASTGPLDNGLDNGLGSKNMVSPSVTEHGSRPIYKPGIQITTEGPAATTSHDQPKLEPEKASEEILEQGPNETESVDSFIGELYGSKVGVEKTNLPERNSQHHTSSTDFNTHFPYIPLKEGSKQIRVLTIEPATRNASHSKPEPIRCKLEIVDLDETTPLHDSYYNVSRKVLQNLWGERASISKLEAWHMANLAIRYNEVKTGRGTEEDRALFGRPLHELLKPHYDIPLEEVDSLLPRFTWGDYIALSYVWGEPTHREQIIVNDCDFSVTRNLFLALKWFQESPEIGSLGLKLWIDAICINQNDVSEREREVKKMGLIYSAALAVRGWVGNPCLSEEDLLGLRETKSWLNSTMGRAGDFESIVPDAGVVETFRTLWPRFFGEEYWARLWILQEMCLASSFLFLYGDCYFNHRELRLLARLGCRYGYADAFGKPEDVLDGIIHYQRLIHVQLRLKIREDWEIPFTRQEMPTTLVVELAYHSEATDPRDKVYGLLALLPDEISKGIHPSYAPEYDYRHAWSEFSQVLFTEAGNINHLARIDVCPEPRDNLPSWVFNLSRDLSKPKLTPTSRDIVFEDGRQYEANGHLQRYPTFSKDGLVMFCEGIFVDHVDSLANGFFQDVSKTSNSFEAIDQDMQRAFHKWFVNESDPEEIVDEAHLPLSIDMSSKLALARVLCHSSHYEFERGPSLLDIPWPSWYNKFGLPHSGYHKRASDSGVEESEDHPKPRWSTLENSTHIRMLLHQVLGINARFKINEVPLREYFSSQEIYCEQPDEYNTLAEQAARDFRERRLCTTQDGLIGAVPMNAVLGDRIAVLLQCDMPVILRPKGAGYEYIGSCFVEGLMKGEAIERMEKGEVRREAISLC